MRLVPAKNSTGNGSNSNNTYRTKQITAAATVTPTCTNPSNVVRFWLITLAINAAMLIIVGIYVLPVVYKDVFENETLVVIGIIGSLISGIVGSVLFNGIWSPGRTSGIYAWWEYLLSALTALGFVIGFGIAMGLVILALYILFYLFVGALIITLIAGVLSGG